jgi:hypothetical protein
MSSKNSHQSRVVRSNHHPQLSQSGTSGWKSIGTASNAPAVGAEFPALSTRQSACLPVSTSSSNVKVTRKQSDEELARQLDAVLNNRHEQSDAALAAMLQQEEQQRNSVKPKSMSQQLDERRQQIQNRQQSACSSQLSSAARMKFSQLRDLYPSVDEVLLESIFAANSSHLHRTLANLREIFPHLVLPDSALTMLKTNAEVVPASTASRTSSAAVGFPSFASNVDSLIDSSSDDDDDSNHRHDIVSLIDSMLRRESVVLPTSESFSDFRTEAQYFAGQRNLMFGQAAAGSTHSAVKKTVDSVLRVDLIEKAQQLNQQMHQANRNAMCEILVNNHRHGDISQKVDLHGLHVKEACLVVRTLLDRLRTNRRDRGSRVPHTLSIITGAGTHSAGMCFNVAIFT